MLSRRKVAVRLHPSFYLLSVPCADEAERLLLYSTRRGSLAVIDPGYWRAATAGRASRADMARLERLGMLVADPEAERREALGYVDDLNRRNTRLAALIVLNLDCNLDCLYCWEGRLRGRHYMSEETAAAVVDFLASRMGRSKTHLDVVFYGGEPLLSAGLLARLARALGRLARSRAAHFCFRLITNGTLLTPGMVKKLLPLGLSGARVTLDGPRLTHDRARPFRGGGGSFETVMRNVETVSTLLPLEVGGNYTLKNHHSFPGLLDELAARGLGPARIPAVSFDPVIEAGTEPDSTGSGGCRSSGEPWVIETGLRLREEILRRGWPAARPIPSPCPVDVEDDFTIDYDGTLYKCPGFMGRGELAAGDVRGGIREHAAANAAGVWRGGECPGCRYLPLCFGGCRYMRLLREGNLAGPDCLRGHFDAFLPRLLLQDVAYGNTARARVRRHAQSRSPARTGRGK